MEGQQRKDQKKIKAEAQIMGKNIQRGITPEELLERIIDENKRQENVVLTEYQKKQTKQYRVRKIKCTPNRFEYIVSIHSFISV